VSLLQKVFFKLSVVKFIHARCISVEILLLKVCKNKHFRSNSGYTKVNIKKLEKFEV